MQVLTDLAFILFILAILAILLQTITIKVLTDLVILFPAAAIDMQVLTDLEPAVFGGARLCGEALSSCSSCASWPSCFRRSDAAPPRI